MAREITYLQKLTLCNTKGITLDGRPATLRGARLTYAIVASLDGKLRGEWSWKAVEKVIKEGGRFTL